MLCEQVLQGCMQAMSRAHPHGLPCLWCAAHMHSTRLRTGHATADAVSHRVHFMPLAYASDQVRPILGVQKHACDDSPAWCRYWPCWRGHRLSDPRRCRVVSRASAWDLSACTQTHRHTHTHTHTHTKNSIASALGLSACEYHSSCRRDLQSHAYGQQRRCYKGTRACI